MKRWATKTDVLNRLRSGEWELGKSELNGHWVQKGGLCNGGRSLDVQPDVVELLINKGLIEMAPPKGPGWLTRYKLKARK